MKGEIMKKFYIGNNVSTQNCDEEKTLAHITDWLECDLKEGEQGTIYQMQYIDEDEIEYEMNWAKAYKKINGKLILIEQW